MKEDKKYDQLPLFEAINRIARKADLNFKEMEDVEKFEEFIKKLKE